jgi:branched-chain amino acid transport system substrate-binding protein
LAHQIWQERINERGGLLGREIELVCVDDRSDASAVAGIYEALIAQEKVDLLLGGYGNNSISPAMPIAIEHEKFFVGLMGLGVNIPFSYDRFAVASVRAPVPSCRWPASRAGDRTRLRLRAPMRHSSAGRPRTGRGGDLP